MDDDAAGCLGVIFLVVVGLVAYAARDSSLRYQLQYSANASEVTVYPRPSDCDFLGSPVGLKDCHYEKTVYTESYGVDTSSSRPIISFDNGAAWTWNDGGPKKGGRVLVSWEKKVP